MRALVLVSSACVVVLAGCGHPASRGECQEIVTHTAELELRSQGVIDQKDIADRVAAPGSTEKMKELVDQCIGTRVTSGAMECVRHASTSKQMETCFQ
jgi:hypothetical protein